MRKRGNRDRAHPDGLTTDELTLWWHVVGSVTPLAGRNRARDVGARDEDEQGRKPLRHRTLIADGATASMLVSHEPRRLTIDRGQPLRTFRPSRNPRAAKKLARGHVGIDARLDLHGLRHDEARLRLRHFLRDAQARGHATVLVITGKGRASSENGLGERRYGSAMSREEFCAAACPAGLGRRTCSDWFRVSRRRQHATVAKARSTCGCADGAEVTLSDCWDRDQLAFVISAKAATTRKVSQRTAA